MHVLSPAHSDAPCAPGASCPAAAATAASVLPYLPGPSPHHPNHDPSCRRMVTTMIHRAPVSAASWPPRAAPGAATRRAGSCNDRAVAGQVIPHSHPLLALPPSLPLVHTFRGAASTARNPAFTTHCLHTHIDCCIHSALLAHSNTTSRSSSPPFHLRRGSGTTLTPHLTRID